MSNLATLLSDAAHARADRVALRLDERALTYAELDGAAGALAARLVRDGLRPGDRVGLMLPNVPEFAVCYFGVLRAGGVVVPMNVQLKAREIAYYLGDSGAAVLLAWADCAEDAREGVEASGGRLEVVTAGVAAPAAAAAPLVAREPGDTAVILYTSGTTGKPKGARLTHANLLGNAHATRELLAIGEPDVIFGGLPLFHSFGQTCAMNAAVGARASLTLLPRFDAGKALELLERDRVTVFEGVPTMYAALLGHQDRGVRDIGSLRVCASGGASLPVELLREFEATFGCTILEGYGLSETSPVAAFNRSARERKPGSVGVPIDGVEMRVVDEHDRELPPGEVGEIVIRGHNVMAGYWRRPDATAEAMRGGWFHTGDLAKVDEDGYFFIVDRKKDLIIRGGYNVYPREVEEVLYEHPAVAEAAVFGIPDERLGEEVAAAVALRAGARVTAEQLRDHVRAALAAYKYPREVRVLETLPKGPTGKILKRALRALSTDDGSHA